MTVENETQKLVKLREITQEYAARKKDLQTVWENMQNFAQGLRNELDDMYWSEHRIAFTDLEDVPEFNQYRFIYGELDKVFKMDYIKYTLDRYRELQVEKEALEKELGVSMDRKT